MVPLVLDLEQYYEEIESIITVTAQHRENLDQVLGYIRDYSCYDLDIMKDRQTLVDVVTLGLEGLGQIMKEAKPEIVLVQDTIYSIINELTKNPIEFEKMAKVQTYMVMAMPQSIL